MSSIPVDVLADILLRLPAKTLLRFKCVCKLWYNLIDSSDFVNRHVDQCNMHIIFKNPIVYMCDFVTFENPSNLEYPFKNWEDGGLYIIGLCRGLICFSIHDYPFTIFLYNPTTQTYKTLPFLPVTSTFDYPKGHRYTGFGYDHVSQDYRCVRIFIRQSDDGLFFRSQVMVYSLKFDVWKRGAYDLPYYMNSALIDYGYSVSLNRVVHWSVEGDRREPLPIVCLNFNDESFSYILLPDSHIEGLYHYKRAHIGVVDGCLCVILNYYSYSDVWIIKEYGVATSWTCLCRVPKQESYEDMRPISGLKNRKGLLVYLTLVKVAYLDLETLEIMNVQPTGYKKLWGAYVFLENLLVFRDGEDVPRGTHQLRNRNSRLRKLSMIKTERYSFCFWLTSCIVNHVSVALIKNSVFVILHK
ncbi:F-box protein CPR1 [Bienertia sinuspersici]